jgi:amidohydrolase
MRLLLLFAASTALASPRTDKIRAAADAIQPEVVALRRDLHMHPELSNREVRTGKVLAERMRKLGLEVRENVAGHGVIALLRGGKPGATVALRADIDALPVDETLKVPYCSLTRGVKHACGHDAHAAMLAGAAMILTKYRAEITGNILFLFQPAEEGAPAGERGGAALVVESGALTPKPGAVFGQHVMPQAPVGTIALRPGAMMASSDRLHITITGKGSHGAWPHEGIDAITVAAEAIGALQTIRSRRIDPLVPMVLSVGLIQGGRRYNIIADEVKMEGTLRALEPSVRDRALGLVRETLAGITAANGAAYKLELDDSAAVLINDEQLTPAVRTALGRVGNVIEARPQMVAEDFSAYRKIAPSVFWFLGVRNEARGITAPNHTAEFDVDEAALPVGVTALCEVALDWLDTHH